MWHFCSEALSQKIDKIQERALGLLYNDSYSDYGSLLLKTERPTMEVSRLRRLAIEVFKTLKSLNLRTLGPKIWNSLPKEAFLYKHSWHF